MEANNDNNVPNPTVNDPDENPNDANPVPGAGGINENGLTPEEQAAYLAYYTRMPQYHPDQIIARADRNFGIVQKDNPFLMGYPSEDTTEPLRLGQVNMVCEYNVFIPQWCTLSHTEQQILFHSNSTQNVGIIYQMTKKNLEKLKSKTGHLLGCNDEGFMRNFLTKVIHLSQRAIIDGTVKRLPVRENSCFI